MAKIRNTAENTVRMMLHLSVGRTLSVCSERSIFQKAIVVKMVTVNCSRMVNTNSINRMEPVELSMFRPFRSSIPTE